MSNNRNSENIFLEGFKQVFWCQKKVTFILFERTGLKNTRKGVQKKKIEQKKFDKKG